MNMVSWKTTEEEGGTPLRSASDFRPIFQHLFVDEITMNHPPRFLLRRGSNGTTQVSSAMHVTPPRPIIVSHGCLLLPVFLAAWWYYTKQCLRKVTGFLRNDPEPKEGSERFQDKFFRFDDANIRWEDVLDDSKGGTRTDRFVKWVNRRNVRRRQAKKEVQTNSERVLASMSSDGSDAGITRHRLLRKNSSSVCSTTTASNLNPLQHQPSMQWECLSDAGDMELCPVGKSTSATMEDESVRTSGSNIRQALSEEELTLARSMPTLTETASSTSEPSTPFDDKPMTGMLA